MSSQNLGPGYETPIGDLIVLSFAVFILLARILLNKYRGLFGIGSGRRCVGRTSGRRAYSGRTALWYVSLAHIV